PILMTACAMTVGMVPMALALERSSQMQAPLGRAVIGGLVMSTFATLLVVPSIFALVIGRRKPDSPSISPDDRESAYFDPRVLVDEVEPGHHDDPDQHDEPGGANGVATDDSSLPHKDDVLGFLRKILDEARSKRHDMVTHYTIDDLRVALGFAKSRSDEETARLAAKYVSADPHTHGKSPAADGGHAPGSEPDGPTNPPSSHGDL
ncbi:MAG TPA: efflux RND transporter permease subunit, partial [Isosphaeraceae bacterium]|nr:efflux RND transporter permease subunit [Isosphaeraceae bacterium]